MENTRYQSIRLRLNFAKSNKVVYKHLLGDAGLLTATFMLSGRGALCAIMGGLTLAALMFRSFSMMHESVHGASHSQRGVNEWIGHVYGVFCLLPYSQWKQIHLQHHLWAGNLDRDPTMRIIKVFRDSKLPPSGAQEFAWRWWLPYLAFRQQVVFWSKSSEGLWNGQWRANKPTLIELSGIFLFIASCILAFGAGVTVISVAGYLFMVELINFPHHLGLPQSGGEAKLAPAAQYKVARSVIYAKWFNRFVLLNFNYHVEHHLFPTLPWHQLETAHEIIRQELGVEFNLSHGNEWLKSSRQIGFEETLKHSVLEEHERLQKTKLVS